MQTLNQTGIRSMVLLGGMLVLAAVAVGAFRSAVLLASTMAITGVMVEFLKTSPPSPVTHVRAGSTPYPTQWPSGHAAFQGSLALGIVLWWWAAGLPRPSIVAAVLVPFAVLVGYSRAFLGIHWLSEVLSRVAASRPRSRAFVVVVDRLVVPRLPALPTGAGAPVARRRVGARRAASSRRCRRTPSTGSMTAAPGSALRWFPLRPDYDLPVRRRPRRRRSRSCSQSSAPPPCSRPLPRFSETLLGEHVPAGQRRGGRRPAAAARRARRRKAGRSARVSTPEGPRADVLARRSRAATDRNQFAPTFYDTRSPDRGAAPAGVRRSRAARRSRRSWKLPLEAPNGCSVWAITAARDTGAEVDWPRAVSRSTASRPTSTPTATRSADALRAQRLRRRGALPGGRSTHRTASGPRRGATTDRRQDRV